MDFKLQGRHALVCASSAGIGKGIATRLAEEGADITLTSRSQEKLDNAKEEIQKVAKGKINTIVCDFSSQKDVDLLYETVTKDFGEIDILVNNQGGPIPGEIDSISQDDLDQAYKTNLLPVFNLTKKCLPNMQKNKWGRIINVLSVSAKQPLPNMLLSNMIRPAVIGLAKSVSNQVAKDGVTVNNILPANVLTDRTTFLLTNKAQAEGKTMDEVIHEVAQGVPAKKMVEAYDFAAMATFLCSDQASFITGQSLSVDGGLVAGLL